MDSEPLDQRNAVTAKANLEQGDIEASAVFDGTPERLFRALSSKEVCSWWVRPGVFDTEEWSGDVRVGGRWAASGTGRGQPYQIEGEFTEVDEPRKLAQTWKPVGPPVDPAMLTYELEQETNGVRMTLRHTGLPNPEVCERTRAGWETSLRRLQEIVKAENG